MSPTRFDRFLAYGASFLIVLSILAHLSTLIAAALTNRFVLTEFFWPVVVWIAYIGLPLGFLMLVILLFSTRRKRVKTQNK